MVQAIIYALPRSDNQQELVLLEFQGSFHAANAAEEDQTTPLNGMEVGDLDLQNDKAVLSTGHHRIEGVRKKLLKPLAVIEKRKASTDAMDTTDDATQVEYDVTTLIREKYVFAHRPRLIVKESLRGLTKIGG
ncbi:Ctf8-domain-containing protein [Gongronella butleri]|nr:Ctf8-domain-containing protein [Gongronella butleri]